MNNRIRASVVACISCLCLLLTYAQVSAITWISKQNGRNNGPGTEATYDKVDKVHINLGFLGDVTRITCKDEGSETCPSQVVIPGRPSDEHTDVEQAGVDFALGQIRQGVLTGTTGVIVPGNPNVKQLKWTASDPTMIDCSIKVWSWGTPEP
ncbi:MAG: hypothetical protein RIR53_343 [Bacteroidota bacterium]|jgi:hypothetical protein